MNILLRKLVRFFPYESVHASSAVIEIEDVDSQWYNAIVALLKRYEVDKYTGCADDYFRLEMDNKITLELHTDALPHSPECIYVTYWDRKVSISTAYHILHKEMWCTVKVRKS